MPVEAFQAADPGVRRIAAAVEASLDALVAATIESIWAEVPAYAASLDDQLRQDVAGHIRGIYLAFLAGLRTGEPTRRADWAVSRVRASQRVVQGITLDDFLQTFRSPSLARMMGAVCRACLRWPRVEGGGQPLYGCADQARRRPMTQGIIDALRHDHDVVRKMFARLDAATGKQRRELFQQLVSELVRHEVAEEAILRPVSKRDAGEAIANARSKEESKAEELLKEMEKLDPGSAEFAAKLAKLRRAVERHAEAEETKEFPRVAKKETAERLEQMGRAYKAVKKAAPTRPHPSTPNTLVANTVVGPLAAVMDRARDAVRDALKSAS